MSRLNTRIARIAAASLMLCALGAHAQPPHWNYEKGHEGPKHWAELDPGFETCGSGQAQSPIDIRQTVKADLPALQFTYGSAAPTLVNNGHTIQVNLPPGQMLKVGEHTYQLLQFHFHTPSEELLQGHQAAMEAHFVHKDENGQLGVIGVLLQPGAANRGFASIFQHLPRTGETVTVEGLQLDLASLLPKDKSYYRYAGSLTTPPCSENVAWMVLKQPVTVSAQQIKAFRQLYPINARPVQPLNGRVVQASS
jgi:carbonic anhydrase